MGAFISFIKHMYNKNEYDAEELFRMNIDNINKLKYDGNRLHCDIKILGEFKKEGIKRKLYIGILKKTKEKVLLKPIINKIDEEEINVHLYLSTLNGADENIIKAYCSYNNPIINNKKYNSVLVMQYVDGEDLFEMSIINKKLKDSELSNIYIKIIKSVEWLHSHGWSHGDIKPENIILSYNTNKIYLIDFGGSSPIKNCNYLSRWLTYTYCSPERVLSSLNIEQIKLLEKNILERLLGSKTIKEYCLELKNNNYGKYKSDISDIYSMGMTFCALTFNKSPFQYSSVANIKNYSDITYRKFKCICTPYKAYPKSYFEKIQKNHADFLEKIIVINPYKRISISELKKHRFLLNNIY